MDKKKSMDRYVHFLFLFLFYTQSLRIVRVFNEYYADKILIENGIILIPFTKFFFSIRTVNTNCFDNHKDDVDLNFLKDIFKNEHFNTILYYYLFNSLINSIVLNIAVKHLIDYFELINK